MLSRCSRSVMAFPPQCLALLDLSAPPPDGRMITEQPERALYATVHVRPAAPSHSRLVSLRCGAPHFYNQNEC
jgi:hypothetical protein